MYIDSQSNSEFQGNVSYRAMSLIKKKSDQFNSQNSKMFSRFGNIWRIISLTVILVLLCIFCYFTFLRNPFFNVTQINFLNTEFQFLPLGSLEEVLAEFKGGNIFMLDSENIEVILKERFSMISDVIVDKKLPNILTVQIKESKLKYNLICSDYSYNLDEAGKFVSKIQLPVPISFSEDDRNLLNGDYLITQIELSNEELDNLKSSFSKSSEEILDEKIQSLKIIKYRQLLFETYGRIFNLFSSANSDGFNLNKIFTLTCSNYGENLSDYDDYKEFILSYSALIAEGTFTPLVVLELKYNRFIVMKDNKYFIFSSLELIEKQIRRLRIVKSNLEKDVRDFKLIDLTQEKVVVI